MNHVLARDTERFYVQLTQGQVAWRCHSDRTSALEAKHPRGTWAELRTAMEDQYLSVQALPRTLGQLVNLEQGDTKTVEQFSESHRQTFSASDRQVARTSISDCEALEKALFETGLKSDLYDSQRSGLLNCVQRRKHRYHSYDMC